MNSLILRTVSRLLIALMFLAGPAQARLDPNILWQRLEVRR